MEFVKFTVWSVNTDLSVLNFISLWISEDNLLKLVLLAVCGSRDLTPFVSFDGK